MTSGRLETRVSGQQELELSVGECGGAACENSDSWTLYFILVDVPRHVTLHFSKYHKTNGQATLRQRFGEIREQPR